MLTGNLTFRQYWLSLSPPMLLGLPSVPWSYVPRAPRNHPAIALYPRDSLYPRLHDSWLSYLQATQGVSEIPWLGIQALWYHSLWNPIIFFGCYQGQSSWGHWPSTNSPIQQNLSLIWEKPFLSDLPLLNQPELLKTKNILSANKKA